jgi:hypothetical protein
MGRGGEAKQQLAKTNAIGDTAGANAGAINSTLTPAYTNLMDTGYFTPEEAGAATTGVMGSAEAPFEAADFSAGETAAATRNPADLTASRDALALEKGRTMGEAAAELQNQKMQGQLAGAYGLGNQANQQTQLEESMYGLGPASLNAQANLENASWTGFNDIYGPLMSSAGAVGGAALGCWVAAELYGGWDAPEVAELREYIFSRGPRAFALAYQLLGRLWAWWIRRSGFARRMTRALFDRMLLKSRTDPWPM